jgi:glucose/arabinose dehydrogenase
MLTFGPDGYLYLALGTGGNLPEDHAHSQDLGSIFGKILRLDVDSGDPYAIPPDNPFLDVPGARGEVWVYGLRNPWRFAFDRTTGDIYIGDAGQFSYEWVHYQAASPTGAPPGGVNFGWPVYEGRHCFDIETETASDPANCQPPPDYQAPIIEYPRGEEGGCVIIGGYVYRGSSIPGLQGAYLYSDFCSARVSAAWRDASDQWQTTPITDLPGLASSFGEDEAGELYLLNIAEGLVYRMVSS